MEYLLTVPDRQDNVTITLEPVRFPVFLHSSLHNRHQLMQGYLILKNHHWRSTGIMLYWRTPFDSLLLRGAISKPCYREQGHRIECLESEVDPMLLRVHLNGFRVNQKQWIERTC